MEQELDDLHADVAERGPEAEAEVTAAVTSRLRRLLKGDPQLAGEVQRVLDEQLLPLLPSQDRQRVSQVITQTAEVSGHGKSYQAGGNITVRGQ